MIKKKEKSALFSSLGHDVPAALVVFLVALPLCLGIALASKAPPFAGLIAGIVGGIVVGAVSGSHVSVSGPAAGLTVIVAAAILKAPSYEAFLVSVVLAGVFQLIMGKLKAGVIGEFIPSSVIKGMLAAIGIILILKQIPHLFGHDAVPEGDEEFIQEDGHNTFTEMWETLSDLAPGAIVIGLVSLGILILWETKFFKKIPILNLLPGSLVAVAFGIGLHEVFKISTPHLILSPNHLVNIPVAQNLTEFAGFLRMPDFSYVINPTIVLSAVTLAIVASLESLLSIEAADKIDPYKRFTPPNRELIAQGTGNIVSGLLGGLPATAVIVRSSANVTAGGRTKLSAILHGVFLLLLVYLFPDFLNKIPLSTLAAVLIFVGYKLTKPSLFKEIFAKGTNQFYPFIITIVAILFTDLLIGILIGITAGIFFILKSNYKNTVVMAKDGDHYLIKMRRDVTFLNKPKIKNLCERIPEGAKVIIDLSKTQFVDQDVRELIEDFKKQSEFRNISLDVRESERHKEQMQQKL
ncbi:MAG: SulP family inorganic anion transporter [Flavobacteriales bacterium]